MTNRESAYSALKLWGAFPTFNFMNFSAFYELTLPQSPDKTGQALKGHAFQTHRPYRDDSRFIGRSDLYWRRGVAPTPNSFFALTQKRNQKKSRLCLLALEKRALDS
jgi:hypothetical protein